MTISDLIVKMNSILNDSERFKPIYCDYARPEAIEELKRAGFNAIPAYKAVKAGIDYVKSKEIYLNDNAGNTWKEVKLYSWKTYKDTITDEPVKLYDDGLDAIRYALYTGKKTGSNKWDYEIAYF